MLDQISISECNKFIHIVSNQNSELKDIKESIQRVMSIYKSNGIDKVFIDERNRNSLISTAEYLQIAMFMIEITSGLIKFAVLINENVSSRDFFKAAFSIKGGSISYFNDKTSALSWLMSEGAIH